jgi:hypothetical protein
MRVSEQSNNDHPALKYEPVAQLETCSGAGAVAFTNEEDAWSAYTVPATAGMVTLAGKCDYRQQQQQQQQQQPAGTAAGLLRLELVMLLHTTDKFFLLMFCPGRGESETKCLSATGRCTAFALDLLLVRHSCKGGCTCKHKASAELIVCCTRATRRDT